MAIKQRRIETPKERAVADRVKRARKSYPRFDRHGGYMEACAALAEETGADPVSIYEEWNERAATRAYVGDCEIEDAEAAAMEDVRAAYRRAS